MSESQPHLYNRFVNGVFGGWYTHRCLCQEWELPIRKGSLIVGRFTMRRLPFPRDVGPQRPRVGPSA